MDFDKRYNAWAAQKKTILAARGVEIFGGDYISFDPELFTFERAYLVIRRGEFFGNTFLSTLSSSHLNVRIR